MSSFWMDAHQDFDNIKEEIIQVAWIRARIHAGFNSKTQCNKQILSNPLSHLARFKKCKFLIKIVEWLFKIFNFRNSCTGMHAK